MRPKNLLFAALTAVLVPAGASSQSVNRKEFEGVIARVNELYAPAAVARGARLRMRLRWDNNTVDAKSKRDGNVYLIDIYGGLARHPAMTADALALFACHEIGHHLGGAPKMRTGPHLWGSTEGQADYFATLKCMRRVLVDADPSPVVDADPFARSACAAAFDAPKERVVCVRSAMAGLAAARLFYDVLGGVSPPRFDTPDRYETPMIWDNYSTIQCRLDTYLQGALCAKPLSEEVDDRDPNAGVCTWAGGAVGARPLCWYRPPGRRPIVRRSIGIRRFLSKSHPALSSLQGGPVWDGR